MACQRCPRLRQELQRTRDNVLLIEGLLEDARRRERTQDTLDRLAMLHKHYRTNYNDMANINFALNHCQNIPRCPGEWNHVPNWNRKQRTVTRVTEHPPQPSDATFEWHVVGVCVPGLACLQVKKKKKTLTLVTSFQWNMSSTPKRRCQAAGVRGRPLSVSFEYVLSDEWYTTFFVVK